MKLFSTKYIGDLKSLHNRKDRPRGFGGKIKPLGMFDSYMEKWKPTSAIDYGCGKGVILEHLRTKYANTSWYGYDPAVVGMESISKSEFDCVFSNDVLEHIEPDCLTDVLQHIDKLANKYIWLRIDTLPARKFFDDGRNAHLIIQDKDWWLENIQHTIDGIVVYSMLGKKGKLDVAIEK